MLAFRSALFNLLFYVTLVGLMIVGLPTLAMGRPAIMRLCALWGRCSLALLRVVCGIEVEWRGRDRIPPGALVVASKHQSFWEVFALMTVFPDFTFVLKRELTRIPLFGRYIVRAGQIAIDRTSGRAALAQLGVLAKTVLADRRQIVIFPEGTRRPPGAPPEYKFGVSFLYGETGARCLPVALNSGLFWPRRSFLRRPGTIVVEFLDPIAPGLDKAEFLRLLEERVEAASNRLLREAIAADPRLGAAGLAPG